MKINVYQYTDWKSKITTRDELFDIQESNMLNSGLKHDDLRESLTPISLTPMEELPEEIKTEIYKIAEKCKNIENFGQVEHCHLTSRCLNQFSNGKIKIIEGYMFIDRTRQTVHHSASKIDNYYFDFVDYFTRIFRTFGTKGDFRIYELNEKDLEIYYSNKLPSFFLKIDDV